MNIGIQNMIGRPVTVKTEAGMIVLAAAAVVLLVTVFALLKAAKVRSYPPVVAFRKGIRTHHFGRNILPLEKSKGNIHITLAMKSFFGDMKSAVGTAVCIAAAGTAILFCVTGADFFKDGIDGLISMSGYDIVTEVELLNGVDPYEIRDEIAGMPDVRKALVKYQTGYLSVKGTKYGGTAVIYDDYHDAENIKLIDGRYPEHDNEVMITVQRKRLVGTDIGDSIVIKTRKQCGHCVQQIRRGNLHLARQRHRQSDPHAKGRQGAVPRTEGRQIRYDCMMESALWHIP